MFEADFILWWKILRRTEQVERPYVTKFLKLFQVMTVYVSVNAAQEEKKALVH